MKEYRSRRNITVKRSEQISGRRGAWRVLWCSGYHVCFTRRRSRVRSSSEPHFLFYDIFFTYIHTKLYILFFLCFHQQFCFHHCFILVMRDRDKPFFMIEDTDIVVYYTSRENTLIPLDESHVSRLLATCVSVGSLTAGATQGVAPAVKETTY